MREIKFRLIYQSPETDEPNKIYISKPFYLTDLFNSTYQFDFTNGSYLIANELDMQWCKFEQFTGLHDKNGKEIYEGDILQCPKTTVREFRREVCWSENYASFVLFDRRKKNPKYGNGIVGLQNLGNCPRFEEWKIIGNIHQNPELLKERE